MKGKQSVDEGEGEREWERRKKGEEKTKLPEHDQLLLIVPTSARCYHGAKRSKRTKDFYARADKERPRKRRYRAVKKAANYLFSASR